jgi:hypothetical protein
MTKVKGPEFIGTGLQVDEIKLGKEKFKDYLKHYTNLLKASNIQLLEELVWLECLQYRYKKQLGEVTTPHIGPDGKLKQELPTKTLKDSIAEGLTQILDLKDKLGMFENKEALNAFQDWQDMKEKAAKYRREHPLSYKCTCPWCTKYFFLKRKTENFVEHKSPFYADDKVLKNTPLRNLFKDGEKFLHFLKKHQNQKFTVDGKMNLVAENGDTILIPITTKERSAEVLGTSPDYIDWLEEKIYKHQKN